MPAENNTRFVWFWTFWHWCREGHRDGILLRGPLEGIASNWDEWYRHEASPSDVKAIAAVGATIEGQRQFLDWLLLRWGVDEARNGDRLAPRFVVSQIARLDPFADWTAFARHRTTYGADGVAAIVLGQGSEGEAADVRGVEAIAFARQTGDSDSRVVTEGFEPDGGEVAAVEGATRGLLSGSGFFGLLGLWVLSGRRPGSRTGHVVSAACWLLLALTIGRLVLGSDPGKALGAIFAAMLVIWGGLVAHALWVVCREGVRAWRVGRRLSSYFENCHVRLRMNGGLYLKGASAGLAFFFNTLLAVFRAVPAADRRSWIWMQGMTHLRRRGSRWAATGVITREGWLKPVVIDGKIRACVKSGRVRSVLTPLQQAANPDAIELPARNPPVASVTDQALQLGYAASATGLRVHRCRHVAQALMSAGSLWSRRQLLVNVLALGVSVLMVLSLPDMLRVLRPPVAPMVTAPSSASPYWLWVSLDTENPRAFRVRLESEFWANRIALVENHGGKGLPPRAELQVQRFPSRFAHTEDEGTIWVERRRTFLWREFFPGEAVGHFPMAQVARISNE